MCLPVGNCQNISEDMNEDTISVLVRLITEKKGMWPAKVRAAPQNSKDIPYGPHDLGQKNKIKQTLQSASQMHPVMSAVKTEYLCFRKCCCSWRTVAGIWKQTNGDEQRLFNQVRGTHKWSPSCCFSHFFFFLAVPGTEEWNRGIFSCKWWHSAAWWPSLMETYSKSKLYQLEFR